MKKQISLLTGLLPILASAQLVMTNNYYVVLNGGSQSSPTTLVLTNPAPSGITNRGSGWIVSENEFNQVDWKIGTNTGTYIMPFGYETSDYLPLTCDITSAGVGSGSIKFSTYHGSTWDNLTYEPSDVKNMTDYNETNFSNNAVDRFWILDATGYSTKPTPDITFSYIRSGVSSEIADPNYIVESLLIAQRFNSSLSEWYDWFGSTGTDVTSSTTGTVKSGSVPASGFYRSWVLFNDSNVTTNVEEVHIISSIISFPNPTKGFFTIAGLTQGQVVTLYDYSGRNLSSAMADNFTTIQMDISTRANGIYLLRILNTDGSLAAEKKIVKMQ